MPDDPKKPDNLDDDRTFVGPQDAPPEEQQSLGDADTYGGGRDSSLADLAGPEGVVDIDLPLIDLASRYEIEGELGKGGMGAVMLATDRSLKRKVAIKRILGPMASNLSALKRFVTEAQSIAALNHFNIVQIYEFGRDTEGPFLVLEYVSGGSLLDRLKRGKLDVEDAVMITNQLCDGLTAAHQKGIIHRDIKPANILLTDDGIPKLTDFGLARQETVDHGQTQSGTVLGTIDFMPPEQRRDATAVDARSDLWSLAATAYQMITGSSPKVIRLDQLPAGLAPVIGKMLEEDPDQRHQTANEFKAELRKGAAAGAGSVAVELAAGVCPTCKTDNDSSRRFCRGCRASLYDPCLSCKADQPAWEDVCGQCGTSQHEQRDLIREDLATVIEESLALAHAHEYDNALMQLSTVQEHQHSFTEDLHAQAAEQWDVITLQRDEQYQLRDQLVQLANEHRQACDYAATVRELEKIPAPFRTGNSIEDQLIYAQGVRDELAALLQEISGDVKNKRIERLLPKVSRFLELNPEHVRMQKLRGQLLNRGLSPPGVVGEQPTAFPALSKSRATPQYPVQPQPQYPVQPQPQYPVQPQPQYPVQPQPQYPAQPQTPYPGQPPSQYPAGDDRAFRQAAGKRMTAGLCGILVGALGIHKFVLGYTNAGTMMLLGSLLTCGVGAIPMAIIGLIEGIIYLTKSEREFYRIYVAQKKDWF